VPISVHYDQRIETMLSIIVDMGNNRRSSRLSWIVQLTALVHSLMSV